MIAERRLLAAVALCLLLAILLSSPALADLRGPSRAENTPARGVAIATVGPPEVVFDWATDRCDTNDVPDTSARAFRTVGGAELIAGNYVNRRFTGPDLAHLHQSCAIVLNSAYDSNPAAFDDREWIASTWATPNTTVYALIHDEYQGNTHPGRCPSGSYPRCWLNAVTFAISHDDGRTFTALPGRVVATVPYRYTPDEGPKGIFNPTNIVRLPDGYYYVMAHLDIRNTTYGVCLLRTSSLSRSDSWRGWSGHTTFATRFVDPYTSRTSPGLCRPVAPTALVDLVPGSLTYSSSTGLWVLVGVKEGGIYYSVSADLIHWGSLKLLYSAVVPWTYRCGSKDPVNYPSLIDPSSPTRNFQTVGHTAFLYLTLFHPTSCRLGPNRELVRIPVTLSPAH
ncbi:MAG: uncharacterized protein JWM55_1706 [Acidimicrobiaceae bacterium]|nr:uncharacterized protein [Acidimicrobiaceae bacterium]